jgi:hypothetical protein
MKLTVSMFMICLNLNTKAMSNRLAVRIFLATTRNFMKGTAMSENGRGTHSLVYVN